MILAGAAPPASRTCGSCRRDSRAEAVSPIRLTLAFLCLLVPAVAGAADGSIHLYLQPLPPDAARLTFVIASVSAVGANGVELPLEVSLKTVSQQEAGRQRLLASGRLPPGSYSGFVFRITRAALKGERGDVALAVPDPPARLAFPFTVAGQQASLVWLALKYQESVTDGAGFSPVFSAVVPSMPIVGHAAFVTNAGSNTITVVDKHLGQAVAVIDTCAGPAGMALDRYRRRLYVACSKDDEIRAIDVATGEVIDRTRLSPGDRPREVALTPDGLTLLSVNTGSGSISFFNAPSLTRGERINVGNGPNSVAGRFLGTTGLRLQHALEFRLGRRRRKPQPRGHGLDGRSASAGAVRRERGPALRDSRAVTVHDGPGSAATHAGHEGETEDRRGGD